MRGCALSTLALVAGALTVGLCQSVDAGLQILSQNVQIDAPDQQVDFTVNFNKAPNFATTDSFGRPEDSFQYEIVPNTSQPFSTLPFLSIGAVVRGDEIGTGNVMPIRNGIAGGSDPNPASGGWGTVRGTVPFSLNGTQLTFAASFDLLGTTNGVFSYDLISTNFGATVSEFQGTSVSVPLPPAFPIGLMVLAGAGALGLLGRRVLL